MLKDIIEERQKQRHFCKKGGIHTCRLGAIHVYSDRDIENINLHIDQTAQIVAREVLRKVREGVPEEAREKSAPSKYIRVFYEGYNACRAGQLDHLQSLEEELTK
jgi:hypothetical protein